ncbi:MAG: xanthine dehydrogenase family protein molybdopterin-binding subunit [Acidobacteria bacterium]|nr:xanthine dehydrogenase family protein molybdopterin-binding subunit [Acidobacteriota bacterium]
MSEKKREFYVVNHSVPRGDGVAKVTGQAKYASDVVLPGMAYAKLLRSPYAHARILSIKVGEAEAQPGVFAVLTGDRLEGLNPYYGHAVKDHPVLAMGKVRYVGEPVVAVVAVDERTAFQALDHITVQYEEMPAVLSVEQALAKGAPILHERTFAAGGFRGFEADVSAGRGTNICQEAHVTWGDADKAFAEAAAVVEGEYYYPMAYAYAMEPYVCVAEVNESGVTCYSSCQHPFIVRHDVAGVFNLPVSKVRLVVPFVGGGYGSKSYTKIEPLTAACAWKARRPVKLQLSVEEAVLTTRSDDALVRERTAVDAQGKLLARQATIYLNTGAYAENSPLVCEKAANRAAGPYRIPNARIDCYGVYTNTAPASSFRGFGSAQVTLAAESQIDEIAEKIGQDPLAFRLANVAERGEVFFPKSRPLDGDLKSDLKKVADLLGWDKPLPKGKGRAVGCTASDAGAYPVTSAAVRVHGDGSVSVLTGSTELGQGSHTIVAQIAAEEIGVPFEKVRVVGSDTAITPFDRSTGASRTTTLMGRAVLEACQDAVSQMRAMAADVLRCPVEEVTLMRGGVQRGADRLDWSQVLARYFGLPDGEVLGRAYLRKAGDLSQLPVFWELGCLGVQVSVDEETGRVHLEKLAVVGDVGLAINPALAEGQDLGAATMGMGIGLYEELIYDGEQLVNNSLLDYRVPRFSDLPEELHLALTENQDGVGPYGAKGGGEGSLNPISSALVNALYRATGVRLRRVPLLPERVWRALRDARHGRESCPAPTKQDAKSRREAG